ncbi:MAG: flagellar hook-basal body complex protein [Planctomycetaceae bacterium]|nr:flagellar hook-basal body complex protein [Planctomycetaceae bacterium]
MGLASALSTALTGLTASETTIDVVGNNLANSNTVGFKSSTASFSTQFLQTLSLGSQPTAANGGTNPRQVGLGTMVSDITPNFNQGTLEISSNPTDLAIQGDGFFIVEGGQGETLYTRNGIFKFNSQNEMVTITGNRLLGFGIDDQFQIQRTTLVPITIPLGAAAVAQPTANVYLEGTLSPTGDVATQAQRIQTGILGDGTFSAPPDSGDVSNAQQPSVLTVNTASVPGATTLVAGDTYEYKLVWADDYALGNPNPTESRPSDTFTRTVANNGDSINMSNLPTSPPTTSYTHLRVYRRKQGAASTDYNYIGQVATGTTTFSDTVSDAAAAANPVLDEQVISGNYSYYVTYVAADGTESRPGPLSGPINVTNGRVTIDDLPQADIATTDWRTRRIYRCLATDSSTYHLVGEIPNMDAGEFFVDNYTDAQISANPIIDLDGPKIGYSTRLVDILSRDGSVYNQVFQTGTLEFTGKKGGRTLDTKEFEITANTTVQQLIDFMDASMGIQSAASDPVFPIPGDMGTGMNIPAGGLVDGGRIILTGNNGVDNAIDIGLSGMLLDTGTSTENVNLPWGVLQEAVGESAVTDFLVYDSLGIPIRVRLTAVMEERNSTSTTYRWFADSPDNDPTTGTEIAVGTGRITFDGEGNLIAVSESTVSVERRNVASASPLEFDLDFSNISGLAAERSSLAVSRQDGSGPGVLTSFIVGEDGVIAGVFSNGVTRDLGQIRLARFSNPSGLEQKGENLYAEGVNSGLPVEGDPGQQGTGSIVSGAVELSNTDIGSNLIDLILASTMYRGNTRVITTAQEMIDELLSLRR